MQREATVLLVELVLYSKPNCKLLAGLPAAPALFADCMSGCGDYVMQLDLAEVLFRYCYRQGFCTTWPPVLHIICIAGAVQHITTSALLDIRTLSSATMHAPDLCPCCSPLLQSAPACAVGQVLPGDRHRLGCWPATGGEVDTSRLHCTCPTSWYSFCRTPHESAKESPELVYMRCMQSKAVLEALVTPSQRVRFSCPTRQQHGRDFWASCHDL